MESQNCWTRYKAWRQDVNWTSSFWRSSFGCPPSPSCGSTPSARPGAPSSPAPCSSARTSIAPPPNGSRTHLSSSPPTPWAMSSKGRTGRPPSPTTSACTSGSKAPARRGSCTPGTLVWRIHIGALLCALRRPGARLHPTGTKVYLFNPATRDSMTLPESNRNKILRGSSLPVGLGLDPRSHRQVQGSPAVLPLQRSSHEHLSLGDGGVHHWRCACFCFWEGDRGLADPPYPVVDWLTAKYVE